MRHEIKPERIEELIKQATQIARLPELEKIRLFERGDTIISLSRAALGVEPEIPFGDLEESSISELLFIMRSVRDHGGQDGE